MKEIKVIQSYQYTNNYKTLKRVAAYARVSTKLEMQTASLALQIKHYAKEIIFNPEYIFAGIYADHGKSGTSMKKRDGFQNLLKKIYAGQIDLVLVKSLSRFARNTINALTIIKETRKIGVEFYFEKEGISSLDPAIDMLFTMMASLAEQESDSMGQNISWGYQKKAQTGKVSIHECVGYTKTKDKKFIINKSEAEIVRQIFDMKLNGHSLSEILTFVKTTGLLSKKGMPFTNNSQIKNILEDIKYTGQVIWGKTYTGKLDNEKVQFINSGQKPKYIIKNHHEPIIDLNIYNQVQELLNESKRESNKEIKIKNPFSQFVYSLNSDKYLDSKVKYERKTGSPIIYSRNATHVLRKATIALARKFSGLESEFDQQVNKLLNVNPSDKKMISLGEDIRKYKNEYHAIKKKDVLNQADLALLSELEELIIELSMDYVKLEDENLPNKDIFKHVNKIKRAIASVELPMTEMPLETVRNIFDVLVIVDPENYVLAINARGNKINGDALKKATAVKPLLESSCNSKTKELESINWYIILIKE